MKGIRAGLLFLFASWPMLAQAGEVQWRPSGQRPASQPPVSSPLPSSAVSLGRPVPSKGAAKTAAGQAVVDPHVTPVAFQAAAPSSLQPIVRFQDGELPAPLPEPEWPSDDVVRPEAPAQSGSDLPLTAVPTPVPGGPDPASATAPPVRPECCWIACQPAARYPRLYGSAEYLLWWIKDSPTPPLVTTGSLTDPIPGALGQPGTRVLFGGQGIDNETRSGGRFGLGWWLDPCHVWALEGSFFFLGQRSAGFSTDSNSFPVIARPFFNQNLNTEFSEIVADPTRSTGGINIRMPSQLWGAEANLRRNVVNGCGFRFDLIGGFRYLDLDEGLHIQESGQILPTVPVIGGNSFFVFDNFDTRNQFYGGQLGAETEIRRGRWFLNMRGKVALGSTRQTIDILGGQTVTTPNGAVSNFQGGLLALPSNIGGFTRDHFAVVPEAGVNVGYQLTEGLRCFVGYTFLYWSNVLRPGDQIDRVIDVNQIPNFPPGPAVTPPSHPLVPFKSTDFWAQGLNFGLEYRY